MDRNGRVRTQRGEELPLDPTITRELISLRNQFRDRFNRQSVWSAGGEASAAMRGDRVGSAQSRERFNLEIPWSAGAGASVATLWVSTLDKTTNFSPDAYIQEFDAA